VKIQLARGAEADLERGYLFYEAQGPGVGDYFLASLRADLSSLAVFGGIHPTTRAGLHRAVATRFPYLIYYRCDDDLVSVIAVLDSRRDPDAIRNALAGRGHGRSSVD